VKKFGFSDNQRLCLKNDFKSVFKKGRKLTFASIVMWCKPSGLENVRLGIIVSKKLGGAVIRNRIKRIIREVFRLNRHKIVKGTDILLYPVKAEIFGSFFDAQDSILSIWKKAGILKDE
jgi:ribonuclease P protein component